VPEIAPFRGILADPTRADLDALPAPGTLPAWLAERGLVRDERPAIYRYHQVFARPEIGGLPVVRRGFIAMVRLHEIAERVVRPLRATSEARTRDSLKSMRAAGAHLSPVSALYSDPSGRTDEIFKRLEAYTRPCFEGTTDDGTLHRIWRVHDAEILGTLSRIINPLDLYLAEGQHRYEAMLAWRAEQRERAAQGLSARSAAEFGTLFSSNLEEAGLLLLPVHRVVRGLVDFDPSLIMDVVQEWFDVDGIPGGVRDGAAVRAALRAAGKRGTSFAVALAGSDDVHILTRDPASNPRSLEVAGPRVLACLDVTVLDEILLKGCVEMARVGPVSLSDIDYVEEAEEALARVSSGAGQMCVIMNAPRIEQLRLVADSGRVMPAMAARFFPKIPSGLIYNPVDPDEQLR